MDFYKGGTEMVSGKHNDQYTCFLSWASWVQIHLRVDHFYGVWPDLRPIQLASSDGEVKDSLVTVLATLPYMHTICFFLFYLNPVKGKKGITLTLGTRNANGNTKYRKSYTLIILMYTVH